MHASISTDMPPSESRLRNAISFIGAFLLGAVLIVATIGKVSDPIVFVEQIRNEGLDLFFSANTVALIALALETGLGLALVLGIRHWIVLVPSSALVAFFLFLTGRNYYLVITGQRDNSYDCGCFGVFLQRTAVEAFWQDLFLLLPPLLLAFAGGSALTRPLKSWKVGLTAVGTLALIAYVGLVVKLPTELARSDAETVSDATVFRISDQFTLLIDGQEDTQARIYESDVTLQFLVVSEPLGDPVVLDVKSSKVFEPGKELIRRAVGMEFPLPTGLAMTEAGAFSVGAEGLSFEFKGHRVVVRSRA